MKDAFWTAGSPKYTPYESIRRTIAVKIEDETKPPPAAARACKSCGRITTNPCL